MRAVALVVGVSVLVAAGTARAQSPAAYAYSYEIETSEMPADKVLVVWPRTCGARPVWTRCRWP